VVTTGAKYAVRNSALARARRALTRSDAASATRRVSGPHTTTKTNVLVNAFQNTGSWSSRA
jgi:hypothetical protein